MTYNFTVLIEKDEDGDSYVATVPALKSCYTHGKTVSDVLTNIRDAIMLCLEEQKDELAFTKFVGVQQMEVAV